MKTQICQRVLDLLSRPFSPVKYFQTNERLFIGESFKEIISEAETETSFFLGDFESFLLSSTSSDSEIFKKIKKIIRRKELKVPTISFLDLAIYLETECFDDKFEKYMPTRLCYVKNNNMTLSVLISHRGDDNRLELNAFKVKHSSNNKDYNKKDGTQVVIKK
jgi:hypothetical protein